MFSKRNHKVLGFVVGIPLLASLLVFANFDAVLNLALKGEMKKAFVAQAVNDDHFEVMFFGVRRGDSKRMGGRSRQCGGCHRAGGH